MHTQARTYAHAYMHAHTHSHTHARAHAGLLGEGAVQVLYSTDDFIVDPILAAVGQLQFEVVQYRMKDEYGVDTTLEPLSFSIARCVCVPKAQPAPPARSRREGHFP